LEAPWLRPDVRGRHRQPVAHPAPPRPGVTAAAPPILRVPCPSKHKRSRPEPACRSRSSSPPSVT
jgi:hypothetical protein